MTRYLAFDTGRLGSAYVIVDHGDDGTYTIIDEKTVDTGTCGDMYELRKRPDDVVLIEARRDDLLPPRAGMDVFIGHDDEPSHRPNRRRFKRNARKNKRK